MAYQCIDCKNNIGHRCDYRIRIYPIAVTCASYDSKKVIPINLLNAPVVNKPEPKFTEDFVFSKDTPPKAIFYSRLAK